MTSQEFKSRIAGLFDKGSHVDEKLALLHHLSECIDCIREFLEISKVVEMLTPNKNIKRKKKQES